MITEKDILKIILKKILKDKDAIYESKCVCTEKQYNTYEIKTACNGLEFNGCVMVCNKLWGYNVYISGDLKVDATGLGAVDYHLVLSQDTRLKDLLNMLII